MRNKILFALAAFAAVLLVRNLYVIFFVLGDEANQGAIWRIFEFHFPASIFAPCLWIRGWVPAWKCLFEINSNRRSQVYNVYYWAQPRP